MAKENTVKTIKVSSVSVSMLAKANSGNASATRKVKKTSETCWAQTILLVDSVLPLAEIDVSQEEDVIKEQVRDAFKNAFMDAAESGEYEIPEKGINARNGNTIDVIDGKTGEVKWSSWDVTRNSISACGEIGQLVKAGLGDQLVVGEKEVLAKASAKSAKPKQHPLDTIKAATTLIAGKYDELSDADKAVALAIVEKCYLALASGETVAEPRTGTDG